MSGQWQREAPRTPRSLAWIVAVLTIGLLAALAGLFVVHRQAEDARRQASTLDQRVHTLAQNQKASRKALTEMNGSATRLQGEMSQAQDDVDALLDSVGELDSTVREQAERTIDIAEVSKSTLPSVVVVECGGSQGSGFAVSGTQSATGTTPVLTNHHVISECTDGELEVEARRASTTYETRLVSWDEEHDLALLELDADLPRLEVADTPEKGDEVVAIGAPLGLEESVTVGVVSNMTKEFFQTDAGINPGNSGGPLIDRHGQVLGVNTMTAADRDDVVSIEGISWAVRMGVACSAVLTCAAP